MWSLKKETNKKPQTKPQQWQKAPKNSLWHMLNVPLLLIVTEDNFSFLCFRYREVSRLPSVHLTTQPHKPSNVLVSVLFPHFHATLPATTGRRALGQPPFASSRRTQRTSFKSSSALQEAQTTCYCGWNLRIKSSSKLSVWHFFGKICSKVKFSNINWKKPKWMT